MHRVRTLSVILQVIRLLREATTGNKGVEGNEDISGESI